MIEQYELQVSEWDRANGIGPQLLRQAKRRAIMVAQENQDPTRPTKETQFYRGIYAEIISLIDTLENAGISHVE